MLCYVMLTYKADVMLPGWVFINIDPLEFGHIGLVQRLISKGKGAMVVKFLLSRFKDNVIVFFFGLTEGLLHFNQTSKLRSSSLRAVVCKIRTILKSRCHTISPNWLKIGM